MKRITKAITRLGVTYLICSGLLGLNSAWASEGNIDSTYKYAWSENAGWLNFRPTNGGVTDYATYLSGYAWAENIGWIKLGSGTGPYSNSTSTNWGVNHDSSTGNLSGYAWSENVGWVNFDSSNGQVTIDPSAGKFDGYAWAENVGWIHFQNASPEYYVQVSPSTITSFTPTSGGTGTSVTITGTDFTGATAVKFGVTAASSFTVNSSTQITAVVAGGSTGTITVTTPGNTATSSGSFTYGAVTAGTYYVDTAGDDSNAGTAAAPWETLHYAITQINGGGSGTYVLHVALGTYSVANGEADSGLVLTQNDVAIIGASGSAPLLNGTGATNWNKGFIIESSNSTIRNLYITGFSDDDEMGIEFNSGSDNVVENCKVYGNYEGINIGSTTSGNTIRSCESYQNGKGILCYSSNNVISKNTIHDNTNDGVYVRDSSPEVSRNKVYDNQYGISVDGSGSAIASPTIKNNLIYEVTFDEVSYGITIGGNGTSTVNPKVYHNTIDGGIYEGVIVTKYENSSINPETKYNIITNFRQYGIQNNSGSPIISYNNVWNNGNSAADNYKDCTAGTGGISSDPKYASYSLQSDSPCIDAIPTGADPGDPVTMDYLGYSRPQGSGFDMGAYEYIATKTYPDTLPGGTGVETDYRIFTVPLNIGTGQDMRNTMEGTLGSYAQTHWRVFAKTTSGDVEMNTQGFTSLDIKPGMGFWLITVYTNTINFQGTLAPDAIYYEIELAPGWHLFAVPWPDTSIELGKIYVTDGVNQYTITDASNTLTQKYIWDYTGTGPSSGYVERSTSDFSLVAGTGYFIKILGSSNITLSIPPNNSSNPPNNNSVSTLHTVSYESLDSVRLPDDSEPPPLPSGSYGPMPNIRANGESGPLTVSRGIPVSVKVSLDPGNRPIEKADWWVTAHTPFLPPNNWYSYVYPDGWKPGIHVCVQTLPFQVPPSFEVLNMALPRGEYTFYFALDENADGIVDETWVDSVDVRVE